MTIGIYMITNIKNNKKYIGQSINIEKRVKEHFWKASKPKERCYNSIFHSAIRKYGQENFSVKVLEECFIEDLDEKEQYYIKKYNTQQPNGYNILPGGQRYKNIHKHSFKYCTCGEKITKRATMCKKCECERRKQNTDIAIGCSIIELVDFILATSFEHVGHYYGYATGNSIKKYLSSRGYPSTKKGLEKYYFNATGKQHPAILEKEKLNKQRKINAEKNKPLCVAQYDLNGTLINTFCSCKQAAKKTGVSSSGHISEAARGKRKTAGGFKWKFVDNN